MNAISPLTTTNHQAAALTDLTTKSQISPKPDNSDQTGIVINQDPIGDDITTRTPTITTEGGDGETGDLAPITIEDIMNAWGTASERYDLTGDGTVDINDVFAWLGTPDAHRTPETNDIPTPPATDLVSSSEPGDNTPITIEDIMKAWGTASERYDLNGDGTVDINDVFSFLGTLPSYDPTGERLPDNSPDVALHTRAPMLTTRSDHFAQSVVDTLDKAGFGEKPPTNIHSLVQSMRLNPTMQEHLMQRLMEQYPDGLGINLEA